MWIGSDTELALHWGAIPLMPTLNILFPKFYAIFIPSHMHNDVKSFVIDLLVEGLNEKKVAEERLWYFYEQIAALLFEEGQLKREELTLDDSILLYSKELHYLKCSEHNR